MKIKAMEAEQENPITCFRSEKNQETSHAEPKKNRLIKQSEKIVDTCTPVWQKGSSCISKKHSE